MATAASGNRPVGFGRPAGWPEYVSAALATLLLAVVLAALWRGRAEIGSLPPEIAAHLFTIVPALALTPVLMVGVKGDRLHRWLGYTWCALMVATAVSAFFVRTITGGFSFIHIFVVVTLVSVPRLIVQARRHKVAQHRYVVLGLVFGALLIAGSFSFVGARHLGLWMFG